MRNLFFLLIFYTITLFSSDTFYYQNHQKIELTKLTDGDILTVHYYKTPQDKVVGINDEIIIKFKNDVSFKDLSVKYDFVVLEKIGEKTYLVKVRNNAQTLDIANLLSFENDVESSQPNFLKIINKR